jgi:carbonic anhydrase
MIDFAYMLEGYRRFRKGDWVGQRERWERLSKGQQPRVLVISCSDSRVDPTQIFDAGPGELFMIRNVAALVPPFETTAGLHGVSAALEYAVQVLGVKEILVLGHGACGGCNAAFTQALKDADVGAGFFVASWIGLLDDARDRVVSTHGADTTPETTKAMEFEGVKQSLANLLTFPFVESKVASGDIRLIGAHFAVADGVLAVLDDESGKFEPA